MSHLRQDADVRLAAAKVWLITSSSGSIRPVGNMPYAASAVLATTTVPTDAVSSMTMDDRLRLYVNLAWVSETPISAIGFRLAHLVWHVLFDHSERARAMGVSRSTSTDWKMAADMSLREVLDTVDLIDHGLPHPRDLRLPAGRSAEEYFASISGLPVGSSDEADALDDPSPAREVDESCGSACDGRQRHYELDAGADVPGVSPLELHSLREQVSVAYQGHITGRGTEPAEFERMLKHLKAPVVPWPRVLAAAVRRAVEWTSGSADFTYSRRSRRQQAVPHVILPGMHQPVPQVAIVVDTSGSVDDAMLSQAVGEVDGALRATGVSGASVSVLSCDAAVQTSQRISSARSVVLGGGGGTDLRVGIAAAADLRPRPEVIIVLTDGYTPWPDRRPGRSSVVIALLARARQEMPPTPPWAQRVECLIEQ